MKISDKFCPCISGDFSTCLEQIKGAEFVEFRLDLCDLTYEERLKLYRQQNKFIATCRSDEETTYQLLKEAIYEGATFIDIDIHRSDDIIRKLKYLTEISSCKLIISYHNHIETPPFEELCNIYNTAILHKADLVKICTKVNTLKDNATILSLYNKFNNLIAFGMGELGKITRITSLYCGAPYTYAAISNDTTTAKGQMTISNLNHLNNIICCNTNK